MIKPQAVSWFGENLPEYQLIEEKYKEIIRKNYNLSGFTPIDTPVVERLEVLLSKWADDNEVYAIHRVNWEIWDDSSLWLRFDLTVPLARFVAQYEWELTFPFRRQHIARVYRWERPQKGRFREFYQADVDIIWNSLLPLFADVEILSTIYNSLNDLNFWDFVININNKKFLIWFLESIWIKNIKETISIIDKKDKVRHDKFKEMFLSIWLNEKNIEDVVEFIKFWEQNSSIDILNYYSKYDNDSIQSWISELRYLYNSLIFLWVKEWSIKINPSISRWLNYYTWMVFETFIVWAENMWSISSWGRYENLASNFTKNNYPWVWGSIGLSRLISVLNSIWKIEINRKTTSKVMLVNMWEEFLEKNLEIISILRKKGINTELYLDSDAKIVKQLKYANNKKIQYAIMVWEEEIKNNSLVLKNLDLWEQKEIKISDIWNLEL